MFTNANSSSASVASAAAASNGGSSLTSASARPARSSPYSSYGYGGNTAAVASSISNPVLHPQNGSAVSAAGYQDYSSMYGVGMDPMAWHAAYSAYGGVWPGSHHHHHQSHNAHNPFIPAASSASSLSDNLVASGGVDPLSVSANPSATSDFTTDGGGGGGAPRTGSPTEYKVSHLFDTGGVASGVSADDSGATGGSKITGGVVRPSPDSGLAVSDSGSPSGGHVSSINAQASMGVATGTVTPPLPASNLVVRPQPARSPYEWMKRPNTLHNRPKEGMVANGRTRTKDKYRVVYSDHQRLELEKEFHYSRYITIRRKAELSQALSLSERQVKIWFQNRRAKERKQMKKREELIHKEKIEAAATLQAATAVASATSAGLHHPFTFHHPAVMSAHHLP